MFSPFPFPTLDPGSPWGRAVTTTILEYDTRFEDIEEERKYRTVQYFTGAADKVAYAGFKVRLRISSGFLSVKVLRHAWGSHSSKRELKWLKEDKF